MPEKIQLNEGVIKVELKELVSNSAEEPLNNLLEWEAMKLSSRDRYGRMESLRRQSH